MPVKVPHRVGEQTANLCDTLARVTWCEVVFTRSDGQKHSELVEGTSLYDAAFRALEQVSRLWWFDPRAPIVVRALKQVAEYRLTTRQVEQWNQRRNRPGKDTGESEMVH